MVNGCFKSRLSHGREAETQKNDFYSPHQGLASDGDSEQNSQGELARLPTSIACEGVQSCWSEPLIYMGDSGGQDATPGKILEWDSVKHTRLHQEEK